MVGAGIIVYTQARKQREDMSEASPDSLRDELARQLFIADNWRQPKEQSEDDWQHHPGVIAGVTEYHAKADAIMPTVRGAMAHAWDRGMVAGATTYPNVTNPYEEQR